MSFFGAGGPRRYFAVLGSFAFVKQELNWGVILVDNKGLIHRAWAIHPNYKRYQHLGPHIGLAINDSGLVATNSYGVLSAYSWCGKKLWEAEWIPNVDGNRRNHDAPDGYDRHHDITARNDRIYTFRGPAIETVDANDGSIVSEIHAVDLIEWAARDGLSIFDAHASRFFDLQTLSRDNIADYFDADPFHFNKVDVLDDKLAYLYPDFEEGDMLISLRSLNLIAVIRPDEQRIVWWRYGLFTRQHDASFIEGKIELFDNNPMSSSGPRILRLDLNEYSGSVVFVLSRWNMVMKSKGNFERHGDRLLTVDDDAGRVIAGKLDGSIDFVFENGFLDGDDVINLQIRNAVEIGPTDFNRFEASCK
jgi:hypothetical protein